MQGSFHGRTMATLSATGNRKVQAGFEPLVSGFVRAPYNDIAAIEDIAANNRNVVAILVEPVQGEGGINIPNEGYLKALRTICDQNQWLLMLDEIQSGMARSGAFFSYQLESILPDVATIAKALGNGIPIGACLASGNARDVFKPGNHGSTFGGNPFSSHVGLAVVNTLLDGNLAKNAAVRGQQIYQALSSALSDNDQVVEIRHQGLLIGIEMKQSCTELVQIALKEKLLINVTAGNVIRLLPPLIINEQQSSELVSRLLRAINSYCESLS